jgi:hypothetical protein
LVSLSLTVVSFGEPSQWQTSSQIHDYGLGFLRPRIPTRGGGGGGDREHRCKCVSGRRRGHLHGRGYTTDDLRFSMAVRRRVPRMFNGLNPAPGTARFCCGGVFVDIQLALHNRRYRGQLWGFQPFKTQPGRPLPPLSCTELALRVRIPLHGGLPEPLHGLPRALAHALPRIVARAEVELRARMPQRGGLPVPLQSRRICSSSTQAGTARSDGPALPAAPAPAAQLCAHTAHVLARQKSAAPGQRGLAAGPTRRSTVKMGLGLCHAS